MSKEVEHKVDRAGWPEGPWMQEPDRVQWRTRAGLPGLIVRASSGAWCGYVAVAPGHPLHAKGYEDAEDISVHGGLTFSGGCTGPICHVPAPGEPDEVHWFGFDCSHHGDWSPTHSYALWLSVGKPDWATLPDGNIWGHGTYRDLAFVRGQVERLAEQLAAYAEITK